MEKEHIYDFLAGLNQPLDEVRGCILGLKPLLALDEIFAEVRREEQRKRIMLGSSSSSLLENSAMAACNPDMAKKGATQWCDHCQRPYHTKATCWKLHGKPVDWKPTRLNDKESRAHATTTTTDDSPDHIEASPFSKAQLEILQKLLNRNLSQLNVSLLSTSLVAQKGNFSTAFICNKSSLSMWIVDFGALDHMTGSFINMCLVVKATKSG